MGVDIDQCDFSDVAYRVYQAKLNQNIEAMTRLLGQQQFGHAKPDSKVLGAELEMYIVDSEGRPLKLNEEIRQKAEDDQLTLEINRYNLEYNLTPYSLAQQPFLSTEKEIVTQLDKLNSIANQYGGKVLPIGILPTLFKSDFGADWMTDRERYHVLVDQLFKRRGKEFEIDINGLPPLKMTMSDVTLEGANTSFQVHYRIDPERYARVFNAFQLVTPLVLALSANSPGLFGHNLWHETRVPLFKQSIDTRIKDRYSWSEPSRVSFGQGWVRHSALELFQEIAAIYPPLLPICDDEDPLMMLDQGRAPKLSELRLHQSSVWLWNRPVYDDADGGHLRIELRALPAGPTAVDMVANAMFYIGLAEYYADVMDELIPALPFHLAEYNFYRAAQDGIHAKVIWPEPKRAGFAEKSVIELLSSSLAHARQGLEKVAISSEEINRYLAIIEQRIASKQTGAVWQRERTQHYVNEGIDKTELCAQKMLADYTELSLQNIPVSDWPLR